MSSSATSAVADGDTSHNNLVTTTPTMVSQQKPFAQQQQIFDVNQSTAQLKYYVPTSFTASINALEEAKQIAEIKKLAQEMLTAEEPENEALLLSPRSKESNTTPFKTNNNDQSDIPYTPQSSEKTNASIRSDLTISPPQRTPLKQQKQAQQSSSSTKNEPAKESKSKTKATEHRMVFVNNSQSNRFASNYVSTTKYYWFFIIPWSFPFRFTFEQMLYLYNIYFIVIMALGFIPNVSPYHWSSNVLPVIFILGSAAFRELLDDGKRLYNDWVANKRTYKVVRDSKELSLSSASLKCGDLVRVENEVEFPADLVVISTPDNAHAQLKIETANLDGETNLKVKKSLTQTNSKNTPELLAQLKAKIRCPKPNSDVNNFDGVITLEMSGEAVPSTPAANMIPPTPVETSSTASAASSATPTVKFAVVSENFVPRGARLKRTDFMWGLVVYTGHDTKLLKSFSGAKSKASFMDSTLNKFLALLLFMQQVFSWVCTGLAIMYQNNFVVDSFYLNPVETGYVSAWYVFSTYFTMIILFNLFVPMSLFVSLEFVRALQAWLMTLDTKMRDNSSAKFFFNTTSLNADLSQIQVVFSDKTGTLTQNEMVFKKCAVKGGFIYDEGSLPGSLGRTIFKDQFKESQVKSQNSQEARKSVDMMDEQETALAQKKKDIYHELWVREILLNLSLCNSLLVDKAHGEEAKYEGESPDEIAFAQAAGSNGFKLADKDYFNIVLQVNETESHTYKFLGMIKFTSDRARMSVLVRTPSGEIVCYVKGADARLKELLATEAERQDEVLVNSINQFANEGLRTLVLAKRVISEQYYKEWKTAYDKASEIGGQVGKTYMDKLANVLEQQFELIGATAIEDRLQDQVPETIEYLVDAGIQVWMLTGDKRETAECVAASAHLIRDKANTMVHYVTNAANHDDCIRQLDEAINSNPEAKAEWEAQQAAQHSVVTRAIDKIKHFIVGSLPVRQDYSVARKEKDHVMLIDGASLKSIFGDVKTGKESHLERIARLKNLSKEQIDQLTKKTRECLQRFIIACKHCSTVICCRATPGQKAKMVQMVLKHYGKIGLAIGDGMNDVYMIQEARVGVGILGKEGSQASRSSDYSIPSFRHLKRLLAVHGRYSLIRTSMFVQYSFYKNLLIVFTQFYYNYWSLHSGQFIVENQFLNMYNLLLTVLPPFLFGLFDKDIDEGTIEDNPSVYKEFSQRSYSDYYMISFKTLTKWILTALFHASVIYFFTFAVLLSSDHSFNFQGFSQDDLYMFYAQIGLTIHLMVILKGFLTLGYFSIFNICTMLFSLLLSVVFHVVYSAIEGQYFVHITFVLFTSPKFYLTIALVVVTCLMPDLFIKYARKFLCPLHWEEQQMKREKLKSHVTRVPACCL